MIPKKIHYIWIGNQPKSELILNCIASWQKYLPDYEIIEWNNDSLAIFNNAYVTEALANKKWAFVSDYIRLYALKTEGGIYLDSDVEVTKNLDGFLKHSFFTGYELYDDIYSPVTAVMGAEPQNHIITDLLAEYDDLHFVEKNSMNLVTNTTRISLYFTKKFGLTQPYDGMQTTLLTEHAVIYPAHFFCTPKFNHENFSIHHFNGSWCPSYDRKDKLTLFGWTFARLKKQRDTGDLPLSQNEKIVIKLPVSKKKLYVLICQK